jgi:hypothetical protein
MGPIGRGEGIAVLAVALIDRLPETNGFQTGLLSGH